MERPGSQGRRNRKTQGEIVERRNKKRGKDGKLSLSGPSPN
jgi:hypothetical protein